MITTIEHTPKLKIVVLAAGFSSRLGTPKALAQVHGVSLLRRTVRLAAALRSAGIVVVVPPAAARYAAHAGHRNVTLVRNPRRAQGLSTSMRRGLREAWYSAAALLLPVDLAWLNAHELRRLVSSWRARPTHIHAARIGQGGGTPLILPRRLFPRAMAVGGDVGLRALLAELPPAERRLVEMPSARFDVDTREDLRAARRRWR